MTLIFSSLEICDLLSAKSISKEAGLTEILRTVKIDHKYPLSDLSLKGNLLLQDVYFCGYVESFSEVLK